MPDAIKPANRLWWIGRNNYAEGGTPDRWVGVENWWAAMRRSLGFGKLTLFPSAMPTDQADAVLAGEQLHGDFGQAYAQGGEAYYGFLYYVEASDASYANVPKGYMEPLLGGTYELYQGAYPMGFQPDPHEAVPWERDGLYG